MIRQWCIILPWHGKFIHTLAYHTSLARYIHARAHTCTHRIARMHALTTSSGCCRSTTMCAAPAWTTWSVPSCPRKSGRPKYVSRRPRKSRAPLRTTVCRQWCCQGVSPRRGSGSEARLDCDFLLFFSAVLGLGVTEALRVRAVYWSKRTVARRLGRTHRTVSHTRSAGRGCGRRPMAACQS